MPSRNIFLSYASGNFIQARNALCESALKAGFDEARPRDSIDIDSYFSKAHHNILSQQRGGGYWLWKPQIILQELKTLQPGDLLVYSDAGRSNYYQLQKFPTFLAERARNSGFLLGPTIGQHGPMGVWTKRDAFVLLDMDRPDVHTMAPIQATWSFWTPTAIAFNFLETWLAACTDSRILTDTENTVGLPNLQGFKSHRHDQSALSILARKHNAPYLDYSGTSIERILKIRPQSRIAHLFLKRIADAEGMERNNIIPSLFRSILDIKCNPAI